MQLQTFFETHPRVAIAFSGGVDSTYLLYAAVRCGADVRAYFVQSPFQPAAAAGRAQALAGQIGAPLSIVTFDPLEDGQVRANPPERCYLCKRMLFTCLLECAAQQDYPLLLDGTNASDDPNDRPGMRALEELGVRSLLRECGLTKTEIRRRMREAGLPGWDRPSDSCLATRVKTGQTLEKSLLQRIDRAEAAVAALGFSCLRVRVAGNDARIELPDGQLERAAACRRALLTALAPEFDTVSLDLKGRKTEELP